MRIFGYHQCGLLQAHSVSSPLCLTCKIFMKFGNQEILKQTKQVVCNMYDKWDSGNRDS